MTKIALTTVRGAHRDGSTPGVDRRFTERDLHAYPELYQLATTYLEDYTGTFEPLLSAQDLLAEDGRLPVNIAKLVLNCAYSDPSVRFKLDLGEAETGGTVVDFPPQPAAPAPEPVRTRILTPEPEPEPRRRSRIRMKTRVKAPYGMSRSQGKVLHRVRPHSAYLEYRFEGEDMRYTFDREPNDLDKRGVPSLHLQWECGGGHPFNPKLFFERPTWDESGNKVPTSGQAGSPIGDLVPYCRGGCFSDLCSRCGKMTHLDPQAEPEATIGPCRHCHPAEPKQGRDERGRFR